MASPRRLAVPTPDGACAVANGIKPKPPAAVAAGPHRARAMGTPARGLTPPATAKLGPGSDPAGQTASVAATLRQHHTTRTTQGANRTDGKLVRTRARTLCRVIARSARRNAQNLVHVTHRGQRSFRPLSQAGYMIAPDPRRHSCSCFLPNGGRPYMTPGRGIAFAAEPISDLPILPRARMIGA
jgi:hypothetical protein